jgi:uncharacterized lipoprotein YajG
MFIENSYSSNFIEKLKEKLFSTLIYLTSALLVLIFVTELYAITLSALGDDTLLQNTTKAFTLKFDGKFKNTPGNIMYDADEHIWLESVTNNVKIGKLAGNRQLEFGVKNVLEEYLQEKGLDLTPTATNKLQVQIVYLDVLTTKKNVSIFHKNEEEVVIRMKGILYKDGKKAKEVMVEESSSEISMSTLIVDEGGKFNQTSLSNALKKASEKLITKIFEGK